VRQPTARVSRPCLVLRLCPLLHRWRKSVPKAEHHRWIQPGMPGHACGSQAHLRQCHWCAERPVYPARRAVVHSVWQRPGVRCSSHAGLDQSGRRTDGLHRAKITEGEWILWTLQCTVQGWVPEWRDVLQPTRSTNPDQRVEKTRQHKVTTQCSGLPPTGPENHRSDRPKADHARTIKLDYPSGADHHPCGKSDTAVAAWLRMLALIIGRFALHLRDAYGS